MNNTDICDPKVMVIQPTTDANDKEDDTELASSRPHNLNQYDINLVKMDKEEQGLLIPLVNTRQVAERPCDVKQENIFSFSQNKEDHQEYLCPESLIKTERHVEDNNETSTPVPQSCSSVAGQNRIKFEELNNDEPGLLIPVDTTTEAAAVDSKQELQSYMKDENVSNTAESFDMKPADRPDPRCLLDDDNPGYLCNNEVIVKQERLTDTAGVVVTPEVSRQESNITEEENCKGVELVHRYPGQAREKSSSDCSEHDTKNKVRNNNERSIDNNRPTRRMRAHSGDQSFPCSYCDQQFKNQSWLSRHLLIHTGEKPFSCRYCDKRFSRKGYLATHTRIHTGEKPFACPYCDKQFSHKSYLSTHTRIHTGEKPFSCSRCDKRFSDKSGLTSHIRTHTGEKPFLCLHCDKRFNDKTGYDNHIRIHTGEKPFSCHYCNKQFSCKGYLSRHIRTHTGERPFLCPHCDKRFSERSFYTSHIRIHTGEKPFCCRHCDKRFSHKGSFTNHIQIHSGEKPFSCPHCDKRFGRKSNFCRHLRTHSGNKKTADQ